MPEGFDGEITTTTVVLIVVVEKRTLLEALHVEGVTKMVTTGAAFDGWEPPDAAGPGLLVVADGVADESDPRAVFVA